MRCVGTVIRGIRTPIIKEHDDLADIVVTSLMNAKESEGFEFRDKDVVREFDNAKLYYGKSKLLVGTPSSPNGEHAWTTLDGYIIDTTLMICFPESKRVELGYIPEKEILPLAARVLSEFDTYESELHKQYIKK